MSRKRVLVLEPNRRLAGVYEAYLSQLGYEVRVARKAQAAVFVADEGMPDLVIAELQLPGHNGVEFLYEFRSYAEWRDVPLILLTLVPAHSLQIEQATMDRLGVFDILYKPATTLQTLKLAVANALPEPADHAELVSDQGETVSQFSAQTAGV